MSPTADGAGASVAPGSTSTQKANGLAEIVGSHPARTRTTRGMCGHSLAPIRSECSCGLARWWSSGRLSGELNAGHRQFRPLTPNACLAGCAAGAGTCAGAQDCLAKDCPDNHYVAECQAIYLPGVTSWRPDPCASRCCAPPLPSIHRRPWRHDERRKSG